MKIKVLEALYIEVYVIRVLLLSLVFISFSSTSFAKEKNWKKINIPGAKCGNGDDYYVFLEVKNPSKLLVSFQSGGACWSKSTCFGPNLRAWVRPGKKKPKVPVFVKKTEVFDDHSYMYVPYCTGDTFSGSHVAQFKNKKMHFTGYSNILKTIDHLSEKGYFDFDKVDDFVLHGGSAGGIGALIHSKSFENVLPDSSKKVLIVDSPGLHFGEDFWERFSDEQMADFKRSFDRINFFAPLDDGFVAPYLPEACSSMHGWKVGFIVGSKDLVMSRIFGRISSKDHHKLVYSPTGIANSLKDNSVCSVWVKRSRVHTFLQGFPTQGKKVDGMSALNYVISVYENEHTTSYIDDPK